MKRLSGIFKRIGQITIKRFLRIVSTAFVLSLVTSCYYDPDDKYWVDLKNPTAPPEVNIDFNINSDTVYFSSYAPVILKITASNENIKVGSTVLYIDGVPISYTTVNGAFIITPFSLNAGTHKFKIEFQANSGSNSIADKIGAEMYQYKSRELTFIIQTPITQSSWITEKESIEGLTLTWNPGLVFKSYQLRKTISIRSNSGFFLLDTIYNTSTNTLIDRKYIGESATYQTYGISNEGKSYLLGSYSTLCKLPEIRVIEYQNRLAVTWPESIHAAHIRRIELIDYSSPLHPVTVALLKNTDTLLVLDNSYFGVTPVFTLRYTPEIETNSNTILCFESYYFRNRLELPGPIVSTMITSTCSELIYTKSDSVRVYSVESQKMIQALSIGYSCAVSANGKYMLQHGGNNLSLYSVDDNTLIRSLDITNKPTYFYSVSDNGICAYNTDEGLEIVDFLNNTKHLINRRYSYSGGGYWPDISPDGNYLRLSKDQPYPAPDRMVFAKIQGNSIIPLDSIDGSTCHFYKNDPALLYNYNESTLFIRKIEDLSIVSKLYTGDEYFGNIDFCSNRMITRGKDICHVYDIVTGKLLFTLPMQNGDYVYILSNVVYFEYGNRYKLPN